ncbi:MAG: zinc-binding dehydrogenase [Alphaproteobacteria bacterium]
MRAAIMRQQRIAVGELPVPEPAAGQVLVKSLACGICGSDLHVLQHLPDVIAASEGEGTLASLRLGDDLVMGHEFCAEIVDYGPGSERRMAAGTRVCSLPVTFGPKGRQTVGYSHEAPGGYGEYMVLSAPLLLPVPGDLPSPIAALTEPLAVGWHAVAKARLGADDVPLVIGCGPVGLSVIAGLKLRGVGPIVAADFSPKRRELAVRFGADLVIDPAVTSPYTSWLELATLPEPADAPPSPFPVEGPRCRPTVVFECVGVPGMIDQIAKSVPRDTRAVIVGVCMQDDTIRPMRAIGKELSLQFVLGYTADEFADSLRHLADGKIDGAAMVTGEVGLDGVAPAFEALASPDRHCKIIIEPWS